MAAASMGRNTGKLSESSRNNISFLDGNGHPAAEHTQHRVRSPAAVQEPLTLPLGSVHSSWAPLPLQLLLCSQVTREVKP